MSKWSLPVRERGLKLKLLVCRTAKNMVAPRAGAWIEISVYPAALISCWVAPRAGAWIEISNGLDVDCPQASLPVRERGLK